MYERVTDVTAGDNANDAGGGVGLLLRNSRRICSLVKPVKS